MDLIFISKGGTSYNGGCPIPYYACSIMINLYIGTGKYDYLPGDINQLIKKRIISYFFLLATMTLINCI